MSRDETEPERTYYLRHKPSDGTAWSDPVELNFSGSTADARLTGLDPGTAYDVAVAEDEEFGSPGTGGGGIYQGTLTVGDDGFGYGLLGYDGTGSIVDPYGSISPTTFEVGGIERSITALWAYPESGFVYLEFDAALPTTFESTTEFTLTIGTTVYNSTAATREGESGFERLASPNWSADDMVAVQINFGTPVTYRPGTTLEEIGAFTTPTMPPTLAFEAEMTAGVVGGFTDGYDLSTPPLGSISTNTFEVGGV